MPLARSSGELVSATTAEAVETLPAIRPPTRRAAISHRKLPAKTHIKYESAVPVSVKSSVGLRPMRSDRDPQIGAKRNCSTE